MPVGTGVTTITVAATLPEVDHVRQFLRERLSPLALADEDLFKIELVVVEVCVNIVRYAYPTGNGEMTVSVGEEGGRLTIEIRDSGIPFDPVARPRPDLERRIASGEKGGLGIYLARAMVDEFVYRRENGENILLLAKRISTAP